jgi:DNA polymerase-3 subunit gamma/tau
VGQEHIVRTLRNALTSGRIHHAYLFAGPRGTGKTTNARLLAKAVNCLAPEPADRPCNECEICQAVNEGRLLDLIEIDAASNTGVDDVRELRDRVGFRPNEARQKVYVIDEVHMLSNAAFNALLKTLEEPPPHAIFILATTEPQKIPATILSRCQRFDFRRIPLSTIAARLAKIASQEEIKVEQDALALIARQATGSMRDAESLLDQLAAYDEGGITVTEVRTALGTGAEEAVTGLIEALASGDVAGGLTIINDAVEMGAAPRQFARQMVEHLRALLLTRMGSEAMPLYVPDELRESFQAQAEQFTPRQLAQAVRLFNQAATEGRATWQPQLPLELAFMEAVLPPAQPDNPGKATSPAGPQGSTKAKPRPARGKPSQPPPAKDEPQKEDSKPARQAKQVDGPLTLEAVRDTWEELLKAIRTQDLPLEALLRSGEMVGMEGDVVKIGFAHQFHRGKVEEDDNRRKIEAALEQLTGQRVRVRCVAVEGISTEEPAPAQPAQPIDDQTEDDELIRAAVEKLGAQVTRQSQ